MPFPNTLNLPVSNLMVGTTTLSTAMDAKQGNITVASATGIVTPSPATGKAGSYLFVNNELMQVSWPGISTTNFIVKRGINGTQTQSHLSAATVWIGNAATSSGDSSRPFSGELFPVADASLYASMGPTPLSGTNSSAAPVAGSIYYSQVFVTHDRIAKGIVVLNGATVGTDTLIFALYDAQGNLLASTAATTSAGTSILQAIAFATPIEISGGRSYFIAVQSNGTTALFQKYITGQVPPTYQAGSLTGTAGTIPATIAFAGTFTTATGPIGGIY